MPRDGGYDWLGSHEAARVLGLTSRTLYRLIDLGDLPAYRFGRVIRLDRHEIEDYINSCRIRPGTLGHLHRGPDGHPTGQGEEDPDANPSRDADSRDAGLN
jgi:excisionase family DNA binding protein